jgi:hypothetical protein
MIAVYSTHDMMFIFIGSNYMYTFYHRALLCCYWANTNALVVFPGSVHSEPHEQISWAEFQYRIDDYGGLLSC